MLCKLDVHVSLCMYVYVSLCMFVKVLHMYMYVYMRVCACMYICTLLLILPANPYYQDRFL